MSVVLLILKIIGIVLLSLIGLCMLLMLLIFLWPFSYRVKAHKDAEVFNASARILWLLGLLTATVTYDGKAKLVIRVIGIPVYKVQLYPTEKKETAESEKIRYFKIQGLEKKRCFYLAYNKSAILSPAAEAFLQFVHEKIAEKIF